MREWFPEDAHVTLVHLGRDNDQARVEKIYSAALELANATKGPIAAQITGVGWFWRKNAPTLITLVNSRDLFALRAGLMIELENRRVRVDDSFGFVPHVTLCRPEAEKATKSDLTRELGERFGRAPAPRFTFPEIRIVCGDASFALPFQPDTF